MTRFLIGVSMIVILTGCGADGEPTTPQSTQTVGATNVTVSGSATFGVVRGPQNMQYDP